MIKFASSDKPPQLKPGLRFTPRGKLFLLATTIAALAAYLLNHNLVMLASAMLFAIPIYQYIYLKLAMGNCQVELTWPEQFFNKRTSHLKVMLTRKAILPLSSIKLSIMLSQGKPIAHTFQDIQSKVQTTAEVPFTPSKRGLLYSNAWFISSSAPFGLLQITQRHSWQLQKIVFPELLGQLPPSLQSVSDQKGALPKQSNDFQYLDTYRTGDDVRMIHWRKSTLNEMPVMRRDQSREETLPSKTLVPDPSPYFEHAVKALTTFFHSQQYMRTWLVLEPQGLREIGDQHEMLAYLALVQPLDANLVEAQQKQLKQPLYFSKIFNQEPQRKANATKSKVP